MRNSTFSKLLQHLKLLTPLQKERVEDLLHHEDAVDTLREAIKEPESCPHCSSTHYHKWGIRDGLQRYHCTDCNKTFNALTGTPLARVRHKEKWMDFANDLIESKSIRESANHCGVHKNTTFRWRHRMLNNPKSLGSKHLHGIVEFDEAYFLESHKGDHHLERKPRQRGGKAHQRGISSEQIAVLVVRDRNGNMMDAILFKSNQTTLAEVMLPVIDKDALLCSDAKKSYKSFAKTNHLTLKTVNGSINEHVKEGIYHIQNVNAYDSRLKLWIKRFNGVATKYLESYLAWMRLLDTEKNLSATRLLGIVSQRQMICLPLTGT